MLWLFQAAAQLPPIYVTVQQPIGMPEWEKTLISAGVGALFGFLSSIAMDFVTPYIEKQQIRKTVLRQLTAEAASALGALESCQRIFDAATDTQQSQGWAFGFSPIRLGRIFNDRYEFYFREQKAIVYDIDPKGALGTFHVHLQWLAVTAKDSSFKSFHATRAAIKSGVKLGHAFLDPLNVSVESAHDATEDLYLSLVTTNAAPVTAPDAATPPSAS